LSEGELLDLAVPSGSLNRRVLVMWLYIKARSDMELEKFDTLLTELAEKELNSRAVSASPKAA
jgi:hypothetical protein